jgi:hypothetical protein
MCRTIKHLYHNIAMLILFVNDCANFAFHLLIIHRNLDKLTDRQLGLLGRLFFLY